MPCTIGKDFVNKLARSMGSQSRSFLSIDSTIIFEYPIVKMGLFLCSLFSPLLVKKQTKEEVRKKGEDISNIVYCNPKQIASSTYLKREKSVGTQIGCVIKICSNQKINHGIKIVTEISCRENFSNQKTIIHGTKLVAATKS